jgi:curved DNA-binding protein CbpA
MSELTATPNHYQLFGVPVDAPTDTIRRAWLIRIRRSHPDRHSTSTPEVQEVMAQRSAELNAAWSVLRDDRRRLDYDLDHALRSSRCSACGADGYLRRSGEMVIASCLTCWQVRIEAEDRTKPDQ